MLQLMIVVLAALGVAWNIDPLLRPYVNVAIWALCAGIMLVMGARFDAWLRRWEAKCLSGNDLPSEKAFRQ